MRFPPMKNSDPMLFAREAESGKIPSFQTDLKQWRILLAMVRHGSFASAASHLSVSQPAISYAIAKMEDQLGMCLFQHKGRRVELTESGRVLLEGARHLLLQAAALERTAETMRLSASHAGDRRRMQLSDGMDAPPAEEIFP